MKENTLVIALIIIAISALSFVVYNTNASIKKLNSFREKCNPNFMSSHEYIGEGKNENLIKITCIKKTGEKYDIFINDK